MVGKPKWLDAQMITQGTGYFPRKEKQIMTETAVICTGCGHDQHEGCGCPSPVPREYFLVWIHECEYQLYDSMEDVEENYAHAQELPVAHKILGPPGLEVAEW